MMSDKRFRFHRTALVTDLRSGDGPYEELADEWMEAMSRVEEEYNEDRQTGLASEPSASALP